MTHFLCISVRFLLGRYHGRTEGVRAPEWPPSPLRLFQALVAAAHRGRGESPLPDAEEMALRWLEGADGAARPAPLIVTSETHEATPYVIAVPNNDLDIWARPIALGREPKKQPAELRTMKTVRPTFLADGVGSEDTAVHFLWLLDADAHHADRTRAIDRLARRIVALGWGTDLVAACASVLTHEEARALAGVKWRPSDGRGPARLQRPVPVPGTLDALHRRHDRFLARIDRRGKLYDHVRPYVELDESEAPRRFASYWAEGAVPPRPFTAFALRPGDPESRRPWQAFRLERAAVVAAMLRHAACRAAEMDRDYWDGVPGGSNIYVAGHTRDDPALKRGATPPRFSYLPLPSIGHTHADGMIRRVLVAEPPEGDGRHAEWAATRLAGADLIDEDTGEVVATLERLDRRDHVLPLFIGPSRVWITATPVVLPGYDGLKTAKAEKLFSRACDQAGLPPGSVESFEFVGPPAHAGGAGRFFVPNYLRGWPLRWAAVWFKEEVKGPLALGAGRHCGLGVLATFDH